MNDRHKYRIPMFTDKGHFIEYQYVSLGDIIEVMLCGYNGEPEQCTGLRDRNGNLIYEGDVVKCDIDFVPDGRVGLTRTVIFKDGAFQLSSRDGGFYFIMGFHNIEIIGNIHELEVSE